LKRRRLRKKDLARNHCTKQKKGMVKKSKLEWSKQIKRLVEPGTKRPQLIKKRKLKEEGTGSSRGQKPTQSGSAVKTPT